MLIVLIVLVLEAVQPSRTLCRFHPQRVALPLSTFCWLMSLLYGQSSSGRLFVKMPRYCVPIRMCSPKPRALSRPRFSWISLLDLWLCLDTPVLLSSSAACVCVCVTLAHAVVICILLSISATLILSRSTNQARGAHRLVPLWLLSIYSHFRHNKSHRLHPSILHDIFITLPHLTTGSCSG